MTQVPAPCIAHVLTAVQLLTAASLQAILEADAIILGAPGRQGGMCGEMRLFLDTWAVHQTEQKIGFGALKVIIFAIHDTQMHLCHHYVNHHVGMLQLILCWYF